MSAIYSEIAKQFGMLSKARRKKVGAVLVTSNGVMLPGYNGTHAGLPNGCEDIHGNTLPSVIHAEMNVMAKACREGVSTLGSTLYVTVSPCIECAKLIAAAGVRKVVYNEPYREPLGLRHLELCGVETEWLT